MSPALTESLQRDFPELFGKLGWGFEHGDGWFRVIQTLATQLEALIAKEPAEEREWYRASQVKEKYGTLRFYMTSLTPEMGAAIEAAEEASMKTCEECGRSGTLNGNGWWRVRCTECRDAREQQ